jgi:MFS family permease
VNNAAASAPGTTRLVLTVAMTLVVQALTAMALAVPSVLAPVAAADIGVAPTRVGLWAGMAFLTAMFAGLACGTLVGRYGPVRMFQAAAVCVGLGLLAGAAGSVALLVVSAVLFGAAHGFVNPASSTILAVAAPARMRAVIFSIKQTGVPLGAATAGVALPLLLLRTDWQHAILALALASALVVPLIAPFRARYDRGRRREQRLSLRGVVAPIAEVWADRPVLALAITSGVYSCVQTSFLTYLISYLKLGLGYSLVTAGFVFAMSQLAGVAGRVAWGAVSDRLLPPRLLLGLLGIVMSLCGVAAILFDPGWSVGLVLAVCVLYGATAVGWNGIYLAEVARLAPEGRIATVTGGTQFFTFSGGLLGPPVFGAIAAASGGYGFGFILLAVLPLANAVWLLAPGMRAARSGT